MSEPVFKRIVTCLNAAPFVTTVVESLDCCGTELHHAARSFVKDDPKSTDLLNDWLADQKEKHQCKTNTS